MSGWAQNQHDDLVRKAAILELTLDAMEQGISVFDADLNVVVFNRRFLEILGLPIDRFRPGDSFEKMIRFNAERGDYGPGDVAEQVRSRVDLARRFEAHCFERTRPDGTVIEVRGAPVHGGGFLTTYTDITERKHNERQSLQEALNAARGQLEATLETVSAGIGLYDRDDRLVLFNSHYREVYPGLADVIRVGAPFELILRTAADRGIVADAVSRGEAWFKERLARHRNPSGPFQQLQVDGRWIQIDERQTVDGGIVAVFTDVSKLKQRQRRIWPLRSVTRMRCWPSSTPSWTPSSTASCFSGRTFECGWQIAPLVRCGTSLMNSSPVTRKCGELMEFVGGLGLYPLPADELQDYIQQRLDAIRQGNIAPVDLRMSDGRVVEYQCKSLPDGGRMVTYFDITAYRQTEEALKQSERRFKDFTSSSSDWIWEMGPDLRFTFVSERMLAITKLRPADVIGKTREEFGRECRSDAAWRQHMDDLRAHRPFKNFRYAINTGHGGAVWISVSGLPIETAEGDFGGYRGTASDVTDEVRREGELREAKDRAEQALIALKQVQTNLVHAEKLALLGQLVAGIAHEIKNPLNFVNNFASLSVELLSEMKDQLQVGLASLRADKRAEVDDLFATLAGNLRRIREHGNRADGIVKSMLAHSREGPGEKRPADINALIEESLSLAYHGARAHDPDFNAVLERDLDPAAGRVDMVPQDISRVLLNLFSNGFHATQERLEQDAAANYRPTLRVSTRRVDHAVEIRVRDNGTGIEADVIKKIFTPFFTTKPAGKGTGLGLSLSYDIVVHQHGGTFDVDTLPGDYAEFTVRLPCAGTAETAAEAGQ
ncbi:MAG: PAS-domain containing protein [Rhodospirillales bacterium]|nr:PAS-domain containing protein [Rhodospirillales bacterium]